MTSKQLQFLWTLTGTEKRWQVVLDICKHNQRLLSKKVLCRVKKLRSIILQQTCKVNFSKTKPKPSMQTFRWISMEYVDLLCKNLEWQTSIITSEIRNDYRIISVIPSRYLVSWLFERFSKKSFGLIELEFTKLENEPISGPEDKCAVCLLPSRPGI